MLIPAYWDFHYKWAESGPRDLVSRGEIIPTCLDSDAQQSYNHIADYHRIPATRKILHTHPLALFSRPVSSKTCLKVGHT